MSGNSFGQLLTADQANKRTEEAIAQGEREYRRAILAEENAPNDPIEYELDYGGVFDGFTVTSDADEGL